MLETFTAFCMAHPSFLWSGLAILSLIAIDAWTTKWP